MKNSVVNGLNDVVTSAQFLDYINSPDVALTMPTEIDARQHLDRLYAEGAPPMNWCRSLDELQAVRTVSRNYGEMRTFSGNELSGEDLVVLGLPTPAALFDKVWGLVPGFIKDKIKGWAQDGLEGPIGGQLTEYVKRGLSLLPLPIPSFFLNSVTNVVIPPLVRFVISKINPQLASRKGTDFGMPNYVIFARHTAKSLELMKGFDRRILLASGLKSSELPAQLMETPNGNAPGDGSFVPVDPGEEVSRNMGQPDDRDSHAAIEQFFENETPNGCKPLPLIQVISAQQRTNRQSDEDPDRFGMRVWDVLAPDVQRKVREYALHNPPSKTRIVDEVYTPTRGLLGRSPYLVPRPIIDSFASMKVPEVVEWAVAHARG